MKNDNQLITQYFSDLKSVIDRFPNADLEAFLTALRKARENRNTIFICGNGGSWATASHMVCDFNKNTRMPDKNRMIVIGLGDNIPSLTAYANDEGYDRVFAEPAISLMKPGDVLIAISASGNSPNVLETVNAAKSIGAITLGLAGFDGGQLKSTVDIALVIPSNNIELVEDFHMIVDHILVTCLRM
jgi:D-sedoheptulose 7-phosphate isomerase